MSKRVLLGNLGTSGSTTLYGLRVSKSGQDAINSDGTIADVTNLLFDSINPIGHLPIYKIYDVTVNAATAVANSNNKVVTPTTKTVSFGETLDYIPLTEAYEKTTTNDFKLLQRIDNSFRSGFDYTRTTVPTDEGFFVTAYDDEITVTNFYQSQKTFRVFLFQPPSGAGVGSDVTPDTVDWTDVSVSGSTGVAETNSQTISGIDTNISIRVSTGGTTLSKIEAYNGTTQLAVGTNTSLLSVTVGNNTPVKWVFTNPGSNTSFTATVTNTTEASAFVDSFAVTINSLPTYTLSGTSSIIEGATGTYNISTTNVAEGTTIHWYIVNGTTSDFDAVSGSETLDANGNASFTITAKEDNTIEAQSGEQYLVRISLTAQGTELDSLYITILDAAPSYSLSGTGTIAEGGSGSYTVSTNNVANGTTLYWTINATTADFDAVQGTTTVNNNSAPFTVSAKADLTTEGTEQYTLSVRTGGYTGTVVASQTIYISDDSVTPESGSLSPATASFTEGSGTVAFTATISNQQSSTFNWQITRNSGTVGSGEFSTATSGTFTSTSYNISVGITNDSTSEINYQGETFTITLRSGGTVGSGTFLDSSTFTVYDDDTVVSASNVTIPNNATIHDVTFTNTMVAAASISGRIKNASNTVIKTFTAVNGSNTVTSIADVPSAGGTATYYIELYNGVAWLSGSSYTVTRLGTPSYSLSNIVSIVEGGSGTYTFTKTNELQTTFYWRIEANPDNPSNDFATNDRDGTVTLSSASNASNTFTLNATDPDSTNTNTRGYIMKVYKNSNFTTLLASDAFSVTDNDSGGGGGGGECFIAGSQVLMADRTYKAIEEVKVGDKVIGLEEMVNEVVDLRIHEEEPRVMCALSNPEYFTTDSHPFLDSEGYWTAVNLSVAQEKYPNLLLRELTPGTTLMKYDVDLKAYIPYEVSYINQSVQNRKVYNLNVSGEDTPEIPGNDTYIVDGYIVHNK